ncbi:uracil-DNA glycosylase [Deefgea piscis]|uniref:Uracil-DNA glycosylase n=1 Tax=Deefgea piscis TaxID=2739061 RepID=A0A6M8SQY7_9NEIS|nr:uracil-DNA glycosylase [Deefgea piscis]QKJ67743.1 uracil-DNA glycosylase [Deefgea piscis]
MNLYSVIPSAWQSALSATCQRPEIEQLTQFLTGQLAQKKVIYPAQADWFNALKLVSPEEVKVVILGQDPYHGAGEAHGLAFSVPFGVKTPPSLRNIWQELARDLGVTPAQHGNLTGWAKQGVLLLNTSLTVEANQAGSHAKKGWEVLTDAVITHLAKTQTGLVFVLWGAHAQKKIPLIGPSHCILRSAHPSPLSAYRGFLGCGHFSSVNAYLSSQGRREIDWSQAE